MPSAQSWYRAHWLANGAVWQCSPAAGQWRDARGLAVFTGIRVMQRDTVPQAEQEPFIASPATLLTEVLDPRYESLKAIKAIKTMGTVINAKLLKDLGHVRSQR